MKINYTAQSLDNEKPTIIAFNKELCIDQINRQEILDQISSILEKGKEKLINKNVKLYTYQDQFALKIYPQKTDVEGRKAPILVNIENLKQTESQEMRSYIIDHISWFAKEAQRPLDDDLIEEIDFCLVHLKQKRLRKEFFYTILTFLILFIIYILYVLNNISPK